MRRIVAPLFGLLLAGCGGSVAMEEPILYDDAGNPIVDAGPDAREDARVDGARDTGRDTAVNDVAPEVYVPPVCPDVPAPPPDYRCDPLAPPPGDCRSGQACFPWVEYPEEPCEHEVHRAACFPAGTGTQGDPCSSAACAAGFVCVASGAGNLCVKLCKPGAPAVCPEGFVCHVTDVPGIGGCM